MRLGPIAPTGYSKCSSSFNPIKFTVQCVPIHNDHRSSLPDRLARPGLILSMCKFNVYKFILQIILARYDSKKDKKISRKEWRSFTKRREQIRSIEHESRDGRVTHATTNTWEERLTSRISIVYHPSFHPSPAPARAFTPQIMPGPCKSVRNRG